MKARNALGNFFFKTAIATTLTALMGITVAEAQRPLPPPIMPPRPPVLPDRLLERTQYQAQALARLLELRGHQLVRHELLQVSQLLDQATSIINNQAPPRPPIEPPRPPVRPPYPPAPRQLLYTGICHVDDDPDFAYDQFVVGELRAYSLQELIRQCKDQAYGMYGNRGSSGIKSLRVDGDIPYGAYTARCHIDDDAQFAFDQFVPGVLIGSLEEMDQQCRDLAQDAFRQHSSSGLNGIQAHGIPQGSVSADCHIDDDRDFAFDQFVLGRLYGADVIDVRNRCHLLAESIFGNMGSAGVRNTQYH